eukprot:CAMPEP_0181301308 /NCGR_PEP_ID=MMETSP1101-20121128/7351_1 /TAXON_ID=46948 /ORGANISM="Rhodomonas abbreviata, Strain Caron Lab Isolate" /LENGTH=470 /DNA_ID=CAMNT_0023406597 /DNA_START=403 /DNA_END=1811 /DNA_ORIENTATION=+
MCVHKVVMKAKKNCDITPTRLVASIEQYTDPSVKIDIYAEGCTTVFQALCSVPGLWYKKISSLDLGHGDEAGNYYLRCDAEKLAIAISECTQLSVLNLRCTGMRGDRLEAVFKVLHRCKQLQHLDISRNVIGDSGASILGDVLQHLPELKCLDIGCNTITCQGMASVARGLTKELNGVRGNSNIETLLVQDNFLQPEGAQQLALAVPFMPKLQCINVASNHVGDEGLTALCKGILQQEYARKNADATGLGLQSLNLDNNFLDLDAPEVVDLLCAVVVECKDLTVLSLKANWFTLEHDLLSKLEGASERRDSATWRKDAGAASRRESADASRAKITIHGEAHNFAFARQLQDDVLRHLVVVRRVRRCLERLQGDDQGRWQADDWLGRLRDLDTHWNQLLCIPRAPNVLSADESREELRHRLHALMQRLRAGGDRGTRAPEASPKARGNRKANNLGPYGMHRNRAVPASKVA